MSHVVPFYCIIFSFILHIFERSFSLFFVVVDFFLEVDIDNRDAHPVPRGNRMPRPAKCRPCLAPKLAKPAGRSWEKLNSIHWNSVRQLQERSQVFLFPISASLKNHWMWIVDIFFHRMDWSRGERIVFWWPNTNINRLLKNDRIRIQIVFALKKATEYEYEYYSAWKKQPNTNTNIIRFEKIYRIRIRILFGLKKSPEYECEY